MMTIHSFIEYLKHRWKAKNRHGVHSPFAYAFVEDVIENRKGIAPSNTDIPWAVKPSPACDLLIRRMMAYYGCNTTVCLPLSGNLKVAGDVPYDVVLPGQDPAQWPKLLADHRNVTGNKTIMIITGIHSTAVHSQAWEQLLANERVRMSMDLYEIGLLFFREEFMVKQHFLLKGPR